MREKIILISDDKLKLWEKIIFKKYFVAVTCAQDTSGDFNLCKLICCVCNMCVCVVCGVCVHMCACVVCVPVCIQRLEKELSAFFLWIRATLWTWDLCVWALLATSTAWWSSCLCPPHRHDETMSSFLWAFWGSKHSLSCLSSKHSYSLKHLSNLQFNYLSSTQ